MTHSEPAREAVDRYAHYPVSAAALDASIRDIDAWLNDSVPLSEVENEIAFGESIMLVVHELKRLRVLCASPAPAAGVEAVQNLIDKTEKLIEAADDMGWSCNSSSADQAIREAKEAVRATLASPAATSDETQGGDGVREAHQIDGLSCEYDDDCYTLTWADGRWLTAHTNGTLVAGKSPRQDDIPAVKTSIAALAQSTSAATRGEPVTARYTNWRGETAERTFIPHRVFLGSNEWHPEPQVLIEATDCEKGEVRTFAASGFAAPAESAQVKEGRSDG